MVTFKPIIISSGRKKDGTWPLYIRVTHHGTVRRIATTITCTAADLTRSLKIKSADILDKGNALIARMRSTLEDISPFTLDEWTVDQVVAHIRTAMAGESFRLDFFAFGEKYAATKSPATAKSYLGALNAFERFLGRREIDVNDITRALLLEFVEFIDAEPKMARKTARRDTIATKMEKIPHGASSRHIAKMAHVYEAAKMKYNDEDSGRIVIPRSPFSTIPRKQPPSHGQEALPEDVLLAVLKGETPFIVERTALDAFCLSFLTMGANLADLYRARPFTGDVWNYNRKKTEGRRADGAAMKVTIQPEAQPYIARLQARGSRRTWWLPALHVLGKETDTCTALINRGLRNWTARNGLPRFTFYAARHTWATLARRLGVEKATVDECLCHKGDFDLTDIYAERAWNLMTDANRKVLDYITNK